MHGGKLNIANVGQPRAMITWPDTSGRGIVISKEAEILIKRKMLELKYIYHNPDDCLGRTRWEKWLEETRICSFYYSMNVGQDIRDGVDNFVATVAKEWKEKGVYAIRRRDTGDEFSTVGYTKFVIRPAASAHACKFGWDGSMPVSSDILRWNFDIMLSCSQKFGDLNIISTMVLKDHMRISAQYVSIDEIDRMIELLMMAKEESMVERVDIREALGKGTT